jgi:hypothetical protein
VKDRDTLYPRIVEINDSSNILEIAFDPLDKVMRVTFKGGVKYIYTGVPNSAFGELISAESVGSLFNEYIRNDYFDGEKVDE